MSDYTAQHKSALVKIRAKGSAVTFQATDRGTYDPLTDTWANGGLSSVTGYAVRVGADPLQYQALSLIQSNAATLLFVPTTVGQLPALGSTASWGGVPGVVKAITPTDPNGTPIMARVIVAQ